MPDQSSASATATSETISLDVIDDLAVAREGARRFGQELRGAFSSLVEIKPANPITAAAVARLEGICQLHDLLAPSTGSTSLGTSVTTLVASLAGRSPSTIPAVEIAADRQAVPRRVALAVNLVVTLLLCGDGAGGIVGAEDALELDVKVDASGASVVLRDFGVDPPDRLELGGSGLRRTLQATGATSDMIATPGLVITRVVVPEYKVRVERADG